LTEIAFYQLAQRPIEAVVPPLVVKARAAGHKLLIRADDAALLARIDAQLWAFAPASFVPHGQAAELPPARIPTQPVLLDCAYPPANGADCLMQLGGDVPDTLSGLARVLYLFSEPDLETARARWRHIRSESSSETAQTTYWRENDEGRFEKAA
jgi:DNA polymerase-3 subunit chi